MEIGRLNRRITVTEPPTLVPDGYGGFTSTPGASRNTWSGAKPMRQSEVLRYGLQAGVRAYRFVFRYFSANDINEDWAITYEGRIFKIVSVLEIDEAKNVIEVLANERTD